MGRVAARVSKNTLGYKTAKWQRSRWSVWFKTEVVVMILKPKRLKITFVTRSLNYGGAEVQLVALAKGLHRLGHSIQVIVFYSGGPLTSELSSAGVTVETIAKAGRWDVLGFLFRLFRIINQTKPDVIHGYLVLPNILTFLLKTVAPRARIVWGVRASRLDLSHYDWLMRILTYTESALSGFADLIIANSRAGYEDAISRGFPKERMLIIPNGIDVERFRPDVTSRSKVRRKWGVGKDVKIVGLVGRLDPMKDHPTFIMAAAGLAKERKDVRFVCVGTGPAEYRNELVKLCKDLGALEYFSFIEPVSNMPSIYNAMDILVSCSAYGEGFSNVIGEAMACNVPCVVTEVGDSKSIVGDNALVIPPKNPKALHVALRKSLRRDFKSRNDKNYRDRVITNFSIPKLVLTTETALTNIAGS